MGDESDSGERYKVGYKKPPREHQFKSGQPSANPRGRPKGTRSFASLWDEKLRQTTVVTVNGKRRRINNRKLLVDVAYARAVKGDLKMMGDLGGLQEAAADVEYEFTLKLEENSPNNRLDDGLRLEGLR